MSPGLRDADVVTRYGGEEFLVILPHTSLAGAADLAERIRKRIESHEFLLGGDSGGVLAGGVTASVGVAVFGDGADSAEKLVRAADEHLYRAKHAGRNWVVTSPTEVADYLEAAPPKPRFGAVCFRLMLIISASSRPQCRHTQ